jgi:diguanylate cyclase (GGDEF)-like protein/PAS domain S-box-containing protein
LKLIDAWFLPGIPDSSLLYASSYNPALVVASILIAIFGSYAALSVAPIIAQATRLRSRLVWTLLGALAMGAAVWAMHFVGMLSLSLPCGVYYDTSLTLFSMIPSILASGVALSIISRSSVGKFSVGAGSILLGAGIGAMHYTGMAAMRLEGFLRYDPALFALSIVVAIALAYVALRVRSDLRHFGKGRDILGAIIMGAAISGMHYTAMSAAYFLRGGQADISPSAFSSNYLALAVIIVTGMLTILAIVAAFAYRNLALVRSEEGWRFALEDAGYGVWELTVETGEMTLSRRWKEMVGIAAGADKISLDEWSKCIHQEDMLAVRADMLAYLEGATPAYINEHRVMCSDGSWKWVLNRGAIVSSNAAGKPLRMVGTHTDITERKRAEEREYARSHVLELLAKGAPLKEILHSIVSSIEEQNEAMLCSVLLMDADGRHLIAGAAPSLPDFYNEAIDGAEIGKEVGSCGAAAYLGERVVVEDIQTHPYWVAYRELAARASLGACWSEPIKDSSGQVLGTFAIYHHEPGAPAESDIQLIQQAAGLAGIAIDHSRASEERQLALLVYQNSSEAMMVIDADNMILTINPAFTALTGYTLEEVTGRHPSILESSRHDRDFYEAMWQAIDTTGYWQGEVWNRRKNGEIYAEWLTINSIYNPDGSVHRRVALFSDITKRKESEELIWHQANFDSLTGLPNRHMFQSRLEQEIKKAHRGKRLLGLMFLDLDRFKEVNDTFGHDQGDLLLKDAAERLQNSVRETDIVARLGGDEFTIIVTDLNSFDEIERIAGGILQKIAEPFQLGLEQAYVSVSIGITFYPEDAGSMDQLIKNADQAMYAAKNEGRNRYSYFTQALQESAQNRMRLSKDLRTALSHNEFRIHYQPIVDLQSGAVNKAEALIRWLHPQRGLISPSEFIPIAEETGLIVDIGDWVFRQAATKVKQLRALHNPQFQVSVNKSPVQFHNDGKRHDSWIEELEEYGLPGRSIVIEITEGLLLDATPAVTDKLMEFHQSGVQVALDDFGTGYSSLSYLKKFDIDYLKIDQSFVSNLAPGSSDLALCEAMIVMAHKLEIEVIAEGVETELQRDLLIAAGCDYGQGYLFSKPLAGDDLDELLAKNGSRIALV